MTAKAKKVLEAALELSAKQREELITDLVVSLDEGHDDPDEVKKSWEKEIRRRLKEIDEGKAVMIPWEVARKQLRARLHGKPHQDSSSRKKRSREGARLVLRERSSSR